MKQVEYVEKLEDLYDIAKRSGEVDTALRILEKLNGRKEKCGMEDICTRIKKHAGGLKK